MIKKTLVLLAGVAVAVGGCFPTIDLRPNDDYVDWNDPYNLNTSAATEAQGFTEGLIAMRNLPYAGGDFSEVFHPVGIRNYIDAVNGETDLEPKDIFPEDNGCSYGNVNSGLNGAVTMDWHLCASNLEYSETRVNGHLGGRYEEQANGDFELTVNFDCLNTDDWTLFGSETITGTWVEGELENYTVRYQVDVSVHNGDYNFYAFQGEDVQSFDGETFIVHSGEYQIISNAGRSSISVSEPLHFTYGCVQDIADFSLFSRGVEVEKYGEDEVIMDYGDGECDVTVTMNEKGTVSLRSL